MELFLFFCIFLFKPFNRERKSAIQKNIIYRLFCIENIKTIAQFIFSVYNETHPSTQLLLAQLKCQQLFQIFLKITLAKYYFSFIYFSIKFSIYLSYFVKYCQYLCSIYLSKTKNAHRKHEFRMPKFNEQKSEMISAVSLIVVVVVVKQPSLLT